MSRARECSVSSCGLVLVYLNLYVCMYVNFNYVWTYMWIYNLYLWIYLAVILKTLSCYYLCTAILFRYLVINDANKLEQIWLMMTPKNWCRKYIQKVNMLQREKMQKKYVQHYSYIRLRRKCKKMVRKHATLQALQIYEGQMCLFMWHLTLLAPQVNNSVILGMKSEVGVK